VLALQRLAGNAAVGSLLRTTAAPPTAPPRGPTAAAPPLIEALARRHSLQVVGSPTSAPAHPPEGLARIREEVAPRRAAGVTSLLAIQPPDLAVSSPKRLPDGRFRAAVQPTTSGSTPATSLYPAPGVHPIGQNAGGQTVHVHVTDAAADEIRRGEEEHLMDMEWARHLSVDRASEVVNDLASKEAPTGATADEARTAAQAWVRDRLPAQLRWPDGTRPFPHWVRAYGSLKRVTDERDSNGWHDLTTQIVLSPAEKRRLGVPVEDELRRYVAGTTQIGDHPAEATVRARWDSLAAP